MKLIEFISVGQAIYLVVISIIGGLVMEIVRDSHPQHLTTGRYVMGWVDGQEPHRYLDVSEELIKTLFQCLFSTI